MVAQNCSLTPKVPYPYEVNWHLVTGNDSLTTICSLSKRFLSPGLTVLSGMHWKYQRYADFPLFQ